MSTSYFEDFYGRELGLTIEQYLREYRNDWSWEWCQMLLAEGIRPYLYVPSTRVSLRVETDDGVVVRLLPLGRIARPWTAIRTLSRTPVGRYVAQLANTLAFLRPLRLALSQDRIDVLIVQEYWTARFDILVRQLTVPVVAVDQGLPDRREIKVMKRTSFRLARGVITQTEREAAKVRSLGAEATHIPNAVDTDIFSPRAGNAATGVVRILAVGRLHDAQKRQSDLVRALAMLPGDWLLEIAGRGPDEMMLRTLAAQLGVANRVSMLGFVGDKDELADLYRRATVFAMPSAYEGLPMTLLEAMSCGVPVAGSDIPAISEVVSLTNGRLARVGDPQGLAAAIRSCVEDNERLGAGARQAVIERYSRLVVAPALRTYLEAASAGNGN